MKQIFKIKEEDNWRKVKRVVKKLFQNLTLWDIQKLFRKGDVKINWKKAQTDFEVKKWDELMVFSYTENKEKEKKEFTVSEGFFKKNFKKIFEDDEILILNKPAWVAVHPWTNHYHGRTMIDLAQHYLKWEFVQLVHRLDADTSGVLLFAKKADSLRNLNQQMKSKETWKKYYSLVFWKLKDDSWVLKIAVKRVEGDRYAKVQVAKKWDKDAKYSATHFKIKEQFWRYSLLDIKLETWRMHQIRVHMESIWNPLVLDQMYWNFKLNKKFTQDFWLKRQFLHSYFLEINHPKTWEKISFTAELAKDLQNTLDLLKK